MPTGSFCRTSSSFRDLPSAETGQGSGLPRPLPTATREPRGGGADSCTHWGPGGGTGGQGTTADLWGEQGVTARSMAEPRDPASPAPGRGLEARASGTPPGTAQAEAGCCPSESPARAFLPMATQGHLPQASQEKPGPQWRHLCRSWGERSAGPGAPQSPCPEGSQRALRMGPGLTGLGEEVLDLCNGGMGLHLGKAQATKKSGRGGA